MHHLGESIESLIGGAIAPCQNKVAFLLLLLAKIKFFFQVTFLNMVFLVSFLKAFSPTPGRKAVLAGPAGPEGEAAVCGLVPRLLLFSLVL